MLQMMSIEYTVPSTIVGVPFNLLPKDFKFIIYGSSEFMEFKGNKEVIEVKAITLL